MSDRESTYISFPEFTTNDYFLAEALFEVGADDALRINILLLVLLGGALHVVDGLVQGVDEGGLLFLLLALFALLDLFGLEHLNGLALVFYGVHHAFYESEG